MILNKFAEDLTRLSRWSGKPKCRVAAEMGIAPQEITKVQSRQRIISERFVRVVEAFGYDVEIRYVKRDAGDVSLNGESVTE